MEQVPSEVSTCHIEKKRGLRSKVLVLTVVVRSTGMKGDLRNCHGGIWEIIPTCLHCWCHYPLCLSLDRKNTRCIQCSMQIGLQMLADRGWSFQVLIDGENIYRYWHGFYEPLKIPQLLLKQGVFTDAIYTARRSYSFRINFVLCKDDAGINSDGGFDSCPHLMHKLSISAAIGTLAPRLWVSGKSRPMEQWQYCHFAVYLNFRLATGPALR